MIAKLYGAPLSPFVRKVAIFLEEKSVAYAWAMLPPHSDDPAFSAISPLGKIPAYQDENIGLSDSSVICAYLEKSHPTPALYPSRPEDFAHALWFEEYFDGTMIKPMRAIYAEGFSNQKFFNKAPDATRRAEAEKTLLPMLAYLESQFKGDWLAGNDFSIADITIAAGFANVALAGYTIDKAQFPKLATHLARTTARPSFQKIAKAMDEFIQAL